MIPGHTALGGIEQALADLRAAETDAHQRLDDCMRRLAEARTEEAEGYGSLAAFRLREKDGLGGRLASAATRVRAILALRANDRENLDRRLKEAEAAVNKAAAERATFAAELAKVEEARRDVENEAAVKLAEENDYVALRRAVEEGAHVAQEAERKAKLAEEELNAKRKPYEDDPLFMYLWKRGFATQAYQAGNVARLLDGWVAKLIRYHDARPNYAMLTEIPKRLRDHANRTAALAVEAVETLKTREKAAFKAVGGEKADAVVTEHRKRLDELDAARQRAGATRGLVEAEIDAFAKGDDPRYKEAVALLADALRSEDLDALERAALATPSPEDEAIVRTIAAARLRQDEIDVQMKRIRAELAEFSRRRSEIGQVADGFRRRRYDSDGSYFDNDVVGHLLRGLVTGVLTGADYWARMERGRRWNRGSAGSGPWGGGAPSGSSGGAWGGGPVILPFPTGGSWGGGGGGGDGGGWSGGGGGGGSSGGFGGGGGDGFKTGGNF